ncbi:SagB family peptide dehydrogenase [Streptomyces xiaopingdaonensis]|uniref:SagB family peptide dehydrogenase n=1 Tax=Streptomyces xiaopingdaonensis TaxID=1565415 RepID=UPI0002EEA8C6|nr:SagB family peptide dehydrogenase [Streptomyces xiaopingdaonensis]
MRYRRNPDVLLEWAEGGGPVLVDCRAWRKFAARPELVDLLHHLDTALTPDELHARWRPPGDEQATHALLERLASAGILERTTGTGDDARRPRWTPYERAAHAQAGRGPVPHARRGRAPAARRTHPEAPESVALPEAGGEPSRPLADVLGERRSTRCFAPDPLPLDRLAALLARSARVRGYLPPRSYEQTQRPAPSGGGRHSLDVYLLAREVARLPAGAYHYDPFDHVLHRLSAWDEELDVLQHRTVTLPALLEGPPPASLYLASYGDRTAWKYEGMALSLVYRDTGCLMQTLSLAATDLGLASCLTGRMEAPVTAPFLEGCEEEALHVGNLALGLPGTEPPPAVRVEHP